MFEASRVPAILGETRDDLAWSLAEPALGTIARKPTCRHILRAATGEQLVGVTFTVQSETIPVARNARKIPERYKKLFLAYKKEAEWKSGIGASSFLCDCEPLVPRLSGSEIIGDIGAREREHACAQKNLGEPSSLLPPAPRQLLAGAIEIFSYPSSERLPAGMLVATKPGVAWPPPPPPPPRTLSSCGHSDELRHSCSARHTASRLRKSRSSCSSSHKALR